MSLQIIYGRSGCGKTQYIFNEISKNIDNGRKKYIITPEQFSFSAEKELLRSLEDEEQNSAVINAEVLTLREWHTEFLVKLVVVIKLYFQIAENLC